MHAVQSTHGPAWEVGGGGGVGGGGVGQGCFWRKLFFQASICCLDAEENDLVGGKMVVCPTNPWTGDERALPNSEIFLTVPTVEAGLLGVEAEADTPPPPHPRGSLAGSGAGPGLEGKRTLLGDTPEDGTQGGSCSSSKHRAVLCAGAQGRQGVLWGGAAPESSCPSAPRARPQVLPKPPNQKRAGLVQPNFGPCARCLGSCIRDSAGPAGGSCKARGGG